MNYMKYFLFLSYILYKTYMINMKMNIIKAISRCMLKKYRCFYRILTAKLLLAVSIGTAKLITKTL